MDILNFGRAIILFEVVSILGKAYIRFAHLEKAHNAFSQTEIWPFNSDMFSNEDFSAVEVTDDQEPEQIDVHDIPDEAEHKNSPVNLNPENHEIVIDLQDGSIAQALSDLATASQNTDRIVITAYGSQANEDCGEELKKAENFPVI